MHHFEEHNGELHCEETPIRDIVRQVGTPVYIYSRATLERHFRAFDQAFARVEHLTCFAVKACSNIAVLRLFARMGGGADIVSGGELFRALRAGLPAERILYSGVGKTREELRQALEAGILMFNVESPQELERLAALARDMGREAPVAFRVNPDVDPRTHAYISTGLAKNKFGIPREEALEAYLRAADMEGVRIQGISCHIGSQLTETAPFVEALRKLMDFIGELRAAGLDIGYLDLGGGVGITYDQETPPHPREYAEAVIREIQGEDLVLLLEPGRVIAGNAGILVTEVQYTKTNSGGERPRHFVIVDAAMNDLTRPSLYGAYHEIRPVRPRQGETRVVDVVGPICETGDFLARDRELAPVEQGDLLAVMSAGAYGFTMSSNYNSRPRAAEVLVDGSRVEVIRQRESYEDLIRGERLPED